MEFCPYLLKISNLFFFAPNEEEEEEEEGAHHGRKGKNLNFQE
jgi:hypothetical protein